MIQIDRPSEEISQRALTLFASRAIGAIGLTGELSVRVTSNRQMRVLNRRYRSKDKPTDVLSFPTSITGMIGDIAISKDIATGNARKLGHSLTTELKVLILHGLLHLAGYDHEADRGEMTARESELRGALGLPLGLIERTEGSLRLRESSPAAGRKLTSKRGRRRA